MTKTIGLLLFLTTGQFAFGQDNKAKALEKGNAAIKLEDEGKHQEAIELFKDAQKLDPGKLDYPYEIGFCYMQLKEYEKAIKVVEKLTSHKDVADVVYQLLGNAYDDLGKQDKAIQFYNEGLKKFPNSGPLYLECGVIQESNNEYSKALEYFEKGIELAPKFPSNYYHAGRIYCNSSEKLWGIIYSEIFLNLERNSKRTSEISKLIYDTYVRAIRINGDSAKIDFCKVVMNADDIVGKDKIKFPFCMVFGQAFIMSIIDIKAIDINSLDKIRTTFVEQYFKLGHNKTHPNILIDYQDKVFKEGHSEAYNHWILLAGDEDGFNNWQSSNKDKWHSFVKWFNENGLKVDNSNKFYSDQY